MEASMCLNNISTYSVQYFKQGKHLVKATYHSLGIKKYLSMWFLGTLTQQITS